MRAECLRIDNEIRNQKQLAMIHSPKPDPKPKDTRQPRKSTYVVPARRLGTDTPKASFVTQDLTHIPTPTPRGRTCYGCGQEGHLRGDPKCPSNQQTEDGKKAQEARVNEITSGYESSVNLDEVDDSSSSDSGNE